MQLQLEEEDRQFFQDLCVKYARQTDVLTLEYSGGGDSMEYTTVEGIDVTDEEDEFLTNTLFDALIEAAGHYGFWNNEGGQGTVTITLSTGAVSLHHEDNYTETTDTDTDFTL